MAVPVRSELVAQLAELGHRARQCLARRTERCRERLELTACRWPQPQAIVAPMAQRVDELGERLPRSLASRAGHARADMNLVAGRLPRALADQRIARLSEKLAALWQVAQLVHPERPLSRGYVRVTGRQGATLTQAAQARSEQALTLHFADGQVDATVDGQAPKPPVERKPRRSYMSPQPGLFDPPEE
jgi:exodeoxyribonuclease VII large subunit